MPYEKQLQDAQNSIAFKNISGVVSTSPQFVELLNEVQRRLLRRGSWFDTEQLMSFCTDSTYVVWPRFVGTVVGVRFGNKIGNVTNNHWSFINGSNGWHHCSDFRSNVILEDAGTAPTYNNISQSAAGATGKLIRFYVVNAQDYGKTITLFGRQYGAQPLQEIQGGVTVNGQTLTAANPFATTTNYITNIDSIVLQPCVGKSYLYEYDPVANTMRDLASFEPGETHPRYRRSLIRNYHSWGQTPDANGVVWINIEALVKLKFIPALQPRDFLLIDNFDALKQGIMAIKCEENGDDQEAEIKWTKAIRELNFDLRANTPDRTTVVRVHSVAGRGIRNPY